MGRQLNQFNIMGNLVKDPEVKYGKNDSAYCFVAIGVADDYYNKTEEEWVERTQFIPLTLNGYNAEKVGKVGKGSLVRATGSMANNNYENDDGETVYSYQWKVDELEIIIRKGGEDNEEDEAPRKATAKKGKTTTKKASKPSKAKANPFDDEDEDEDIPF